MALVYLLVGAGLGDVHEDTDDVVGLGGRVAVDGARRRLLGRRLVLLVVDDDAPSEVVRFVLDAHLDIAGIP